MKTPKSTFAESTSLNGVMLTPIDRIDQGGVPWVCVHGRHIPAMRTTSIAPAQLTQAANTSTPAVIALVEDGASAVILGFLSPTVAPAVDNAPAPDTTDIGTEEQVSIRCGKASITLTSAGKVLIRGTYVSSRSSGVNRVKGGSVQIN